MNKYILYVAVFLVVSAIVAQQGEAKSALKKRAVKPSTVNLLDVKKKLQTTAEMRKKRDTEVAVDKPRQKRSARSLVNANIADKVVNAVSALQGGRKRVATRTKRSTAATLRDHMTSKMAAMKTSNRQTRSAKMSTLNKKAMSNVAKLSNMSKRK